VGQALTEDGTSPYVLVVDDEPFFRRYLSDELEHRGYAVVSANDAAETFHFFERVEMADAPVIVVLDLMLPGVNGLELLYALARTVRKSRVRFILCSAHQVLDKVAQAHPLVAGRLSKPFASDELDAAMATASSELASTLH
jgi:DNA-binding response OmpR family regulator